MYYFYPDPIKPIITRAKATVAEEIGLVATLPGGYQQQLTEEIRRHLQDACTSCNADPTDPEIAQQLEIAVADITDDILPRYTRREFNKALDLIRDLMHLGDGHFDDDDHGARIALRHASIFWEQHQPNYDPQHAEAFCPYCFQERGTTCACPSCPACGVFNLPQPIGPAICSACSTEYTFNLKHCPNPKCGRFNEPGAHGLVTCFYCKTRYDFFSD